MAVTFLLDSNVLIALSVDDHVHHRAAAQWMALSQDRVATCPITQGALVRLLLREGLRGEQAVAVLRGVTEHPRHTFWADSIAYGDVGLANVFGHGHVTDAYLVALAAHAGGRLATFDHDLASGAPAVASLIPIA